MRLCNRTTEAAESQNGEKVVETIKVGADYLTSTTCRLKVLFIGRATVPPPIDGLGNRLVKTD